jgi:hypothetical protein
MRLFRQLLLVCSFLILAFVLSSCSGGSRIEDINYYEGSDGLVMEFLPNSPPEKAYPTFVYPVTILIHNEGAFSLQGISTDSISSGDNIHAEAMLIYDSFYFSEAPEYLVAAEQVRSNLHFEGKSVYWPSGESRAVTVGYLKANDPGPNRIGADADIGVSLCFPYETKLTTPVCVDNDPYENADPMQPCHIEDLSFQDQGAPVAIKDVEVESLPVGTQQQNVVVREPVIDSSGAFVGTQEVIKQEMLTVIRPVFRLYLENVGGGQIIRGRERSEQKSCLKDALDDLPSNSVIITAFLGNKELSCLPSPVVFIDDKTEVMCMMKPEDDLVTTRNYFDILQVYVSYVYQTRQKVNIVIDNSAKTYTPPSMIQFTCMDFDNDYNGCKAYGHDELSGRDCFYCDKLKKCMSRAECGTVCAANDPTPNDFPDEYSRLCTGGCPKPSASLTVDKNTNMTTFKCLDNSKLNPAERERCGCTSFQFGFTTGEDCTGISSFSTIPGKYEPNLRSSSVEFPLYDLDAAKQQDISKPLNVCVWGRTAKEPYVLSSPFKYMLYPQKISAVVKLADSTTGVTPNSFCPKPIVNIGVDKSKNEINAICEDGTGTNANDQDKCGCKWFRIAYTANPDCTKVTVWSSNYAGAYEYKNRRSTINLPITVQPNFNAPVYVCVEGLTATYPYTISDPRGAFVFERQENDASNNDGIIA